MLWLYFHTRHKLITKYLKWGPPHEGSAVALLSHRWVLNIHRVLQSIPLLQMKISPTNLISNEQQLEGVKSLNAEAGGHGLLHSLTQRRHGTR